MNDFPAFETFPAPGIRPIGNGTIIREGDMGTVATAGTEPRKRGPRRDVAGPIKGDAPAKSKGGRPKKAKVVEAKPTEAPDPTLRLFQAAVGMQHEDLGPLTVAYQALLTLPAGSRSRVLAILHRVFA